MQTIKEYQEYCKQLEGEVKKWHDAYDASQEHVRQLIKENSQTKEENAKLKAENERLLKENSCKFYKDCLRVRNYEQKLRATRRALWLARAYRAEAQWNRLLCDAGICLAAGRNKECDILNQKQKKWQNVERLCKKKAEQYKEADK